VVLRESVTTSGRKLREYSAQEVLGLLVRLTLAGPQSVRWREGLELWYRAAAGRFGIACRVRRGPHYSSLDAMNDKPGEIWFEITFAIPVGFCLLMGNILIAVAADRISLFDEYLKASVLIIPAISVFSLFGTLQQSI
jgi:hypothetical protein